MSCFWKHTWGKWKEIKRHDVLRVDSKQKIGLAIIQERVCEKCNKKELDIQQTALAYY